MGKFQRRHGLADTPIHRSWMSMRQRCLNPNDRAFKNYGGRGISICERWNVFENFVADMGPLPSGHELERIDVNGNYEPANCRWATITEQARNTRRSLMLTYQGRTQCLAAWAEELGLKMHTLYRRVVIRKLSIDEAFSTPVLTQTQVSRLGQMAQCESKRGTKRALIEDGERIDPDTRKAQKLLALPIIEQAELF